MPYVPSKINRVTLSKGEGQTHGKIFSSPVINFFTEEQKTRHAKRILRLPTKHISILEGVARRQGYWKHIDWGLIREQIEKRV